MRFARRPFFDDASTLFEIMTRATGEGAEALAAWRRAAAKAGRDRREQGDEGEEGGEAAARPRRRRRSGRGRRRRRGGG